MSKIDVVNCILPNHPKKNPKTYTSASGISSEMIGKLRNKISEEHTYLYKKYENDKVFEIKCKSNVFIRLTNPGALNGFERKYAIGKPLWAKAKSSDAFLCKANISASPLLAKNYKDGNDFKGIKEILLESKPHSSKGDYSIVNKHLLTFPGHPLFKIENLIDKKNKLVQQVDSDLCSKAYLLNEKIRGLDIQYLVLDVTNKKKIDGKSALCEIYNKNKRVLKKKNEKLRLFSIYLHIEQAKRASDYDIVSNSSELKPIIVESKQDGQQKVFYPLRILAEKWKGKYYEMLADYDLFAVCPSYKSINQDNQEAFYPSMPSNTFDQVFYKTSIDKSETDSDWFKHKIPIKESWLDKIYDEGISIDELGILSWFENEVRKLINEIFEIPVARHGCETNNLYYTSKADDVDSLINIGNDSIGRPKHVIELTSYLNLNNQSNDKGKPFFIPCNPNWVNCSKKNISKSTGFKLFGYGFDSMSKVLCDTIIKQLGKPPKRRTGFKGLWFKSNRIYTPHALNKWKFKMHFYRTYYQILKECDQLESHHHLKNQNNEKKEVLNNQLEKRKRFMEAVIHSITEFLNKK